MKVIRRFAALMGIQILLVVVGIVIPLKFHGVKEAPNAAKAYYDPDFKMISFLNTSETPTPPRDTPNHLEEICEPGFEEGDCWHVDEEEDSCTFFWPWPYRTYDGQGSALIVGGQNDILCKMWSDTWALEDLALYTNHHYYFSGRIRAEGFESGTEAYISVLFLGPNNQEIKSTMVTTDTVGDGQETEWVEIHKLVEVPTQAERVRIRCRLKGKGQAWFDYLFLGLDIKLELTETAYPDLVTPGNPLTYTISYSNTGMEAAQNVEIRKYFDPDTSFLTSTPRTENPPYNDEWDIGTLTTTSGSIVIVTEVNPDTKRAFLSNTVSMESTTPINSLGSADLSLSTSNTVQTDIRECVTCISNPHQGKIATSPGRTSLSHELHNCGGLTSSITLSISAPSNWTVEPSSILVPSLLPSHTQKVETEITVPAGEVSGTIKPVTWTAIATCNPEVQTAFTVSTTDSIRIWDPPYVFMPIVFKNYCDDQDPCAGQDPYEPNNFYCSTKTSLASGASIEAWLCSEADKDDFYYADITTAGMLEIWLTSLPSEVDYDLYLYHEAAPTDWITRSIKYESESEYIKWEVPPNKLGRYYIDVYAYENWSSDDTYRLTTNYP